MTTFRQFMRNFRTKRFYELYGPIFESNADFEETVPGLGDENMSDEDMDRSIILDALQILAKSRVRMSMM